MTVFPDRNQGRALADVVPVVARDDGFAREYFQKLRDMFERVFEVLDVGRPEFVPFEFEGGEEVPFKTENDAQAGVWLATHEGEKVDLPHNEIGPYEGSTLVTDSGVGLIIVETDSADWKITIE